MKKSNFKKLFENPPLTLAISFAVIIVLGAILLNLPVSSQNGKSVGFVNALFTSASATCVTGLTVVNTAAYWSVFGKIVIISLIQIGGLGTMVVFSMLAVILRRRIGLKQRLLIKEQLNSNSLKGLVRLVKYVISVSFFIEFLGALLLSIKFIPIYGITKGILFGIFHSISAFCNAGFDLLGNSLVPYYNDVYLNLVIMGLVIVGGLGFTVYLDVYHKKKWTKFNLHTKLVLITSAILLLVGIVFFLLIENNNTRTIGNMPFKDKLLVASFQSTIVRTAGFNSIDTSKLTDATIFLLTILMFIGGSPASTAGGIKTTTFGVLLFTSISMLKGERRTVVLKKTVPMSTILKALVIVFMCMLLVVFVAFGVQVVEKDRFEFIDVLFETVSAFATVGITRGITPELSSVSKIILTITMFLGRVGPTTLAVGFMRKKKISMLKYSEANIIVG